MSRLSLFTMGSPRIELDGKAVKLDSHKATALLITLALTTHSHPREALVNLLWPDYDPDRGHTNLRHCLYLLRKALPGDWLQSDREAIRLNPAAEIWMDVDQFHTYLNQCLGHGHAAREVCPACVPLLTTAIGLYRGEFLSGFGLEDSLEFDDWQLMHTETLRREFAEVLERLVRYYGGEGSFETAIEHARRWLALDRLNEEVHCQLMRLYAWSGQLSAAIRQYQECAHFLEDQLGISPQAATTALYSAIVRGELLRVERPTGSVAARGSEDIFPVSAGEYEPVERRGVFVARESELAKLHRWIDLAVAGYGQVVFITGDAGRGKTALLKEFTQRAQERWGNLVVAGGNGNAYTGEGDPYLPFREILSQLTGDIDALWTAGAIQREPARRLWDAFPLVVRALVNHGPDLLDTLIPAAALLRRAIAYTAGELSEQAALVGQLQKLVEQKAADQHDPNLQQSALFEQYARVLACVGRKRPLLLVLDDLQWADAASINLLFYLGRHIAGQRILIAGAYRPEEVSIGRRGERHPLDIVLHDLQRTFGDIFIDLEQAEGQQFVEQYLETEPNHLRAGFRETLYRQTGGHPLFTVELLRGMQERGDLVKDDKGYWVEGKTLEWSRLPSRVEAVIAERIARLDASSREMLEIASVEGETFTAEVLAEVCSVHEQEVVRRLGSELDRRHRLVRAQEMQHLGARRFSRYRFQHILYQTYLYGNLDAVRRMYLHEAVGTALEALSGKGGGEMAVSLARHFREAGMAGKAIEYLLAAGEKARQSSANSEAIAYLTQALELIKTLPDTPERARQELECRLLLGFSLVLILGHAAVEVKDNYVRARELSVQAGDSHQRFQVLMGLRRYHHVRGELQAAYEVSEQILAQCLDLDELYLARAHLLQGEILYRMGSLQKAQEHYEQSVLASGTGQSQPDAPLFGNDTLVISQVFQGANLWQLGYPDQALRISLAGVRRARQLAHPFTLVCALNHCVELYHLRREPEAAQELLEELMLICSDRGFALYAAWGTLLTGHGLVAQKRVEAGIVQIQRGLADWKATGAGLSLPGYLANLAEVYANAGKWEEGLSCIEQAFAIQVETGECLYAAELYRIQGELFLAQGGREGEAEACFQQALYRARSQNARCWELRAGLSLGRLWSRQGKRSQVQGLLSGILSGFTEGFDTPDMREARLLCEG